MLKLKLQYFDFLMQIAISLEKTLMLEKIEGRKRRGWQRMKWLDGHHWLDGNEFQQALGDGKGQESLVCCSPWCHKETWLSNWTTVRSWNRFLKISNYLKTCSTRIPGAQSASLHTELPQSVLKVNSCNFTGFSLCRGRWEMPLLLFSLWQVFLASPNL